MEKTEQKVVNGGALAVRRLRQEMMRPRSAWVAEQDLASKANSFWAECHYDPQLSQGHSDLAK